MGQPTCKSKIFPWNQNSLSGQTFQQATKRSAWYLQECFAECFSVGSSLCRNYFKITIKKESLYSFNFDAICFSFYLWHHLSFCLTVSAHCLTWDQLDWLRCTYTRVGLNWSKLCTSGWVVVLWPCLCWMSAPCLSWEQPTGIPQIWHAAPHTRRERERKGEKEKIQFPKNPGWIHYREIKTNFMKFFFFFYKAGVKKSKDKTRNILRSMAKELQGFWVSKFTTVFQMLFTLCCICVHNIMKKGNQKKILNPSFCKIHAAVRFKLPFSATTQGLLTMIRRDSGPLWTYT